MNAMAERIFLGKDANAPDLDSENSVPRELSARKITRVYLGSRWGENVMPLVALTPALPAYLRGLAYEGASYFYRPSFLLIRASAVIE